MGGPSFLSWLSCVLPLSSRCQFKMPALPTPHRLPWLSLRSLVSIWPALPGLRGPSLARGLLGSKAGLPGAGTQCRLGRGRHGGTETWLSCGEDSWTPGVGTCQPEGQEGWRRKGSKNGLQTRRGGSEEVEGRKEQGKVLGSTLSHVGGPDEGSLR